MEIQFVCVEQKLCCQLQKIISMTKLQLNAINRWFEPSLGYKMSLRACYIVLAKSQLNFQLQRLKKKLSHYQSILWKLNLCCLWQKNINKSTFFRALTKNKFRGFEPTLEYISKLVWLSSQNSIQFSNGSILNRAFSPISPYLITDHSKKKSRDHPKDRH